VISIKIIEKRNNELSHKTFDCAKSDFVGTMTQTFLSKLASILWIINSDFPNKNFICIKFIANKYSSKQGLSSNISN
jgi:hypothetical protein